MYHRIPKRAVVPGYPMSEILMPRYSCFVYYLLSFPSNVITTLYAALSLVQCCTSTRALCDRDHSWASDNDSRVSARGEFLGHSERDHIDP